MIAVSVFALAGVLFGVNGAAALGVVALVAAL